MVARARRADRVLGLVSGLVLVLGACGRSTGGPTSTGNARSAPPAITTSSATTAPSAPPSATPRAAAPTGASAASEVAALAAETDPGKWKPRVRELLQQNLDGKLDDVIVFPYLGGLRDKLLDVMDEPESQAKDGRGSSRRSTASSLLALWSDPRDATLVARWLEENKRFAEPAPPGLDGSTIEEALAKWRDYHFTREGFPKPETRTANWLSTRAATDEHALVEHYVRYKVWAYAMRLVLTKEQGQWGVRIVMHTMHEDYD